MFLYFVFLSLCFCSVQADAFGDERERVSVNDGGSVTLHTNLTNLKKVYLISWQFNTDHIATILRIINKNPIYQTDDERFTDRLKMNPQTGDLTITNITSELTGLYNIAVMRGGGYPMTSFNVSLSPKVKNVIGNDSVSLHIDVTEKQRKDKIHWRINHENSLVANIITENGEISTPFIDERFRGRVKLNNQTGDVIITNMKKEDSGEYEANVTIRNTHTIHKTFCFVHCGGSPGVTAGKIVGVLLVIAVVAAAVAYYVTHRPPRSRSREAALARREDVLDFEEDVLDFEEDAQAPREAAQAPREDASEDEEGHYENVNQPDHNVGGNAEPAINDNGLYSTLDDIVSVNNGGSVTLHTDLTHIQREHVIVWMFNKKHIAKINRKANENPVYESNERFTDRLEMNPQTGDLTITNITSEHTIEDYHLEINRVTMKLFSVRLSPKVKNVIKEDSVSLHIDVTDEQRKDKIHWRIKHKNSLVAEIIKENGEITKNEAYNGFRGILELEDQTGDVIITNMKKEDSGEYEADVTVNNTHTIHKTFRFIDSEKETKKDVMDKQKGEGETKDKE